jgi:uncharacterized protein
MNTVLIKIKEYSFVAELYDTPTAEQIFNSLPLKGPANCWGEEIYFKIPVVIPEEWDAHQQVELGEIAYWPVGAAFCIFYGPTPISISSKPKAYSAVNVFGKIHGNFESLRKIKQGDEIVVTAG